MKICSDCNGTRRVFWAQAGMMGDCQICLLKDDLIIQQKEKIVEAKTIFLHEFQHFVYNFSLQKNIKSVDILKFRITLTILIKDLLTAVSSSKEEILKYEELFEKSYKKQSFEEMIQFLQTKIYMI